MKRLIIVVSLVAGIICPSAWAGLPPIEPPHVTDNYDISIGPVVDACLGDPAFFVPLKLSVSDSTIRINLLLAYDQNVITPTLLAPNIFVQSFTYSLAVDGRISMTLVRDLPPPPYVPPMIGDTIFAWISFRITTRDIGYDYPTNITFLEDPLTPYPDNYIVKDNNTRVDAPYLGLHPGQIVLKTPLYGDINLNGYPYEIADGVLFNNYFIGIAHFNRCQYANSDCNRDGLQATIADLVFFLRVLNGDSILILRNNPDLVSGSPVWRPISSNPENNISLLSDRAYDFTIRSDVPLGGASFEFELADSTVIPAAISLDSSAAFMQMYCYIEGKYLRVTLVNWDARNNSLRDGNLFTLHFTPGSDGFEPPFTIISADFSDNNGQMIEPKYSFGGIDSRGNVDTPSTTMALSSSPNPFNGSTSISLDLPAAGQYQLEVYDILGRKVKNLINGYHPAGETRIVWNGRDEAGSELASGTYFVRLWGEGQTRTTKLFMLK
jgi:hypothetical protein